MTSWRTMINPKLWNYTTYQKTYRPDELFAQSKGRANMKICPARGDVVYFVMRGKIIMQGVVESDGFVRGTNHQTDPHNLGDYRPHAEPEEFAWIRVEKIGLSIPIRRTGQQTWVQFNLNTQ